MAKKTKPTAPIPAGLGDSPESEEPGQIEVFGEESEELENDKLSSVTEKEIDDLPEVPEVKFAKPSKSTPKIRISKPKSTPNQKQNSVNGRINFSDIRMSLNVPTDKNTVIDYLIQTEVIPDFISRNGKGEKYKRRMYSVDFKSIDGQNYRIMLKPSAFTKFVILGREAETSGQKLCILAKESANDRFAEREFVLCTVE